MTQNSAPSSRRRSRHRDVFLFSHPRTVSNLLCHLLKNQPGWTQSNYHFLKAFAPGREWHGAAPFTDLTQEQRETLNDLLQEGFYQLQKAREAAISRDEVLFVKNHVIQLWEPSSLSQSIWGGELAPAFPTLPAARQSIDDAAPPPPKTNPTLFTDEFLLTWMPVFLIRHPALTFESWYRAETSGGLFDIRDKAWFLYSSFTYSRQLYDWYLANDSATIYQDGIEAGRSGPIVIDADDIIELHAIEKLCKLFGMDLAIIPNKWEQLMPPADEIPNSLYLSVMGGFWTSTGVDKSKSSAGINIEQKYQEWKEKYGVEGADMIYSRAQAAMPDYEYLKSKKL